MRLIARSTRELGEMTEFAFYGPTCDSADFMPGPFLVPDSVCEGDYLEIGQLGAYGRVLATQFNGGGRYEEAIVGDRPMMTMYQSQYLVEDCCREQTLSSTSRVGVGCQPECQEGNIASQLGP